MPGWKKRTYSWQALEDNDKPSARSFCDLCDFVSEPRKVFMKVSYLVSQSMFLILAFFEDNQYLTYSKC